MGKMKRESRGEAHTLLHKAQCWSIKSCCLNCNAPVTPFFFCFYLGCGVFMKCQDEHALLSALSTTGKIWGISHLEQPAKLAVLSITPNGRGFVFFSVDFERILMGRSTTQSKNSVTVGITYGIEVFTLLKLSFRQCYQVFFFKAIWLYPLVSI